VELIEKDLNFEKELKGHKVILNEMNHGTYIYFVELIFFLEKIMQFMK
jgi:hypothetical protein